MSPGALIVLCVAAFAAWRILGGGAPRNLEPDKVLGGGVGDDVAPAISDIGGQLAATLARISTPSSLPNIVVCVPRYNMASFGDGRAPWIGEDCRKSYAV